MVKPADFIDEVGAMVTELEALGLEPVLIGGMALVILGSRRVTRDFDFLVAAPGEEFEPLIRLFYRRGFELAAKLNKVGDILVTIDNRRVAALRLRLDRPASAYFLNHKTGLRIDLLFDFPLPAAELVRRARMVRVRSHRFRIASRSDLLRLKKLAHANRASAADAQDIAFLRKSRK